MRILITVLGLLLGLGAHGDAWRGLLGAALAFALAQWVHGLKRRLEALELSQSDATLTPQAPAVEAPTSPIDVPVADAIPAVREAPEPEPVAAEAPPAQPEPLPVPAVADVELPPLDRWVHDQGERLRTWLVGGNLPVRVGVVVLLFGVSFLAKYAADHALFPVELRLAFAALLGIALIVVGWRERIARRAFALPLQGGGIGVLYVVVFVALKRYDLLSPLFALALLVLLAAAAVVLALLQDSLALALLAFGGGFAAPVLTSSGGGNQVALFSYYTVLNVGLIAVATYRAWRPLHLLGFAFTFGVAGLWGARAYVPEDYLSSQIFLAIFFVLYLAMAVLYAWRQPEERLGRLDGTLVFGLPIVVFGLQVGLVRDDEMQIALSALAFGLVYLGAAVLLWKRAPQAMRALVESLLVIGVGFGTMALPLAVDAFWTGVGWALEGAGLVWIGVRQRRVLARLAGAGLVVAAGVALIEHGYYEPEGWVLLNGFHLSALLLAASAVASAALLARAPALRWGEPVVGGALFFWGLVWLAVPTLIEFHQRYELAGALAADVMFFAVAAVLFELAGRRLAWRAARRTAASYLAVLGLVFLIGLEELAHPAAGLGALAWPIGLVAWLLVLYRQEEALRGDVALGLHAATLWLVVLWLGAELAWAFGLLGSEGSAWWQLGWAVPFFAAVAVLLPVREGAPWPVGSHRDAYRELGLGGLVGLYALATVVAGSASAGSAAPLPFVALLNPTDVASVGVWLAVAAYLGQLSGRLSADARRAAQIGLGVALTAWLSAAVARIVHHYGDVPYAWDALWGSVILQASWSVVWSIAALVAMWRSSRRALRGLWFGGATLLGGVVLKLFVVDLARGGTVARIVSFIAVGLLLVLVGYLSPLPPRRAAAKET